MAASTRTSSPVDAATLERYADLVVGFGANVQPGQIVEVRAELGKRELVHAIATNAYRRGARFVDVNWFDPYVRRARILHAGPDTLDFVPSWHSRRVRQLGELRCARIGIAPINPPGISAGLKPERLAREPFPFIPGYFDLINEETTNWTAIVCPSPEWAAQVHTSLEPDEALARLWEQVVHVCRLDEPDPVEAWRGRFDRLHAVAERLNERRLDALHFSGPGTDLTVGLLPSSDWDSGMATTVDGIEHASNLPSEEVYTGPDPERTEGVVTATRPLALKGGALVQGLRIRFEAGRAVEIDADEGAETMRSFVAANEGADRLGEVALVDSEGRIGPLGTVFYTTLLDENSASHAALGSAYLNTARDVSDRARLNTSTVHVDFMLGGDDVDVTGRTRDGAEVPVLRGGAWQL